MDKVELGALTMFVGFVLIALRVAFDLIIYVDYIGRGVIIIGLLFLLYHFIFKEDAE